MAQDPVVTLAQAVERLAGVEDALEVAAVVRTAARSLSGADGVAVVLRDGDRVRYVDEDAVGPLWKGGVFPMDACISGWAIAHRQRVVIPDVFADPRIPHELYAPTFVKSCVMTPVGRPDPLACIGAYWREVREPTGEELAALDAVARATAGALENLRLRRALADALARAEAANRAKSDFLTNMSHEIRTPLNGVVGGLALLEATAQSPEQARLTAMLQASSADLEGVLHDVLDFARLQSETARLEVTAFNVADAVREVARLFELRFGRKGLDFRVEVDPAAQGWLRGDRGAVKQVLANLVQNALKFTQTGRVVVSVDAPAAGQVRLSVADTGVGISEDLRARIFESFEQADSSSTRAAGGLGLGLAVVRRLVDLMGGEVSLESRPGAGSIFTVSIPLARAEPPRAEPALRAVAAPDDEAARILVVDDHPVNRTLVSALLDTISAETVEAEDGQAACEAFARERFSAVLMDIQMPVMDGLTATRRIRAFERESGANPTPIIMLSANALPEHIEASREAGADRHLAKPVSPAQLFDTLQAALTGGLRAA
ncbi:ATP-binding protein [Phenylobacterium sp.]|uniref:ATP-binding protein n=1 Tax=Phenylobacterium sp. TaxID=1871053 RepID=UPI00301C9FE5